MPFNPNEYLIKLKGKEYLEVRFRLVWFRNDHPDGTIETELVEHDAEKQFALFKAKVSIPNGGSATGYGSETSKDFADFIEKAECVPLNSEILTRRGFRRYFNLTIGEEVLAYDKTTDQCVWTPLCAVTVHESLPMAYLHNKCFGLYCTSDHSWAVQIHTSEKMRLVRNIELRKANEIKTNHDLILAAPAPGGQHPLNARDAAVLGWIMTDGTIQQKGNTIRAGISQSKQENVEQIRQLVGISATEVVSKPTTRTFPSGKTYDCKPQHWFYFSADETRRLLNIAGIKGSEDLPALVTQLSHEARQAMLISMMLADGDKKGCFGKKRKPGVMEAWQILATLEGFALGKMQMSSIGEVPIQRLKRRRVVSGSQLKLDLTSNAPAWCPTTDYGTWVMRQNGFVTITGNTKAIGRALGALGYGTQFTDDFDIDHDGHVVDAPVDKSKYSRATPSNEPRVMAQEPKADEAKEKAIGVARKLASDAGYDMDKLEEFYTKANDKPFAKLTAKEIEETNAKFAAWIVKRKKAKVESEAPAAG